MIKAGSGYDFFRRKSTVGTLDRSIVKKMTAIIVVGVLPVLICAQSPLPGTFTPPESISAGNISGIGVPAGATASTIQDLLEQAVIQSSVGSTVRVKFAAGSTYPLSGPDGADLLRLEKVSGKIPQNIEIDGQGCTFEVQSWSRFMAITEASNVILKNFRLTYEPKNISQGAITGIIDASAGLIEITIDEGHPLLDAPRFADADTHWAVLMSQQTDGIWGMKPGCPAIFNYAKGQVANLGNRRFRVYFDSAMDHASRNGAASNDPLLDVVELGDRVALLARTDGRGAFSAMRCKNLTYRNIEINHSPSSIFGDAFSERTCYVGITAQPEDGHLFTSTADGIYVANQRNGPWIEDCYLKGIGDDAVVVKNNIGFYKAASADPARPYSLGADGAWLSVQTGDELVVFDMVNRSLISSHTVTAVSSLYPWGDKDVALDSPLTVPAGDTNYWIYNLNNQCNGFVLLNNTFMDNRRWGVLCSGADGSIVSNHFVRTQNAAIYLANSPQYITSKTGAFPRNIEIIGNRFQDCWHAENAHPFGVIASYVNGDIEQTRPEPGHAGPGTDWNGITNIHIEANVFDGWDGVARVLEDSGSTTIAEHPVHAINLRDVSNVRIFGNRFNASSTLPVEVNAIRITDYVDVQLVSNTSTNWPEENELVWLSDVFADDFHAEHRYLSNGVDGTGWDGVFVGGHDGSTVNSINTVDTPGELKLASQGSGWDHSESSGPFLYRSGITRDFVAEVTITAALGENYNVGGLLVRAPTPPTDNSQEHHVQLKFMRWNGQVGIRTVVPGTKGNSSRKWESVAKPASTDLTLRLIKSGDVFTAYYDDDRDGLFVKIASYTNAVLADQALQVGIYQASYNADSRYMRFDDFSLDSSGSDDGLINWAAQYGLTPADMQPDMHSDDDGVSNLREFAFGGNPTNTSDTGFLPKIAHVDNGGTNWVSLIHAERTDSGVSLIYTIEYTTDLSANKWTTSSDAVYVGSGVLNGEYRTVKNEISMLDDPVKFLRIRAE
jgi:regulation of enolase protein 1 (concanavalin A-like superfamily)